MIFTVIAVPQPKLGLTQLEIDIKHALGRCLAGKGFDALSACNVFTELHGEYRLPDIGIGKKHTQLALVPQLAEQHFGFGLAAGQLEPAVTAFNGKQGVCIFTTGPHPLGTVVSFYWFIRQSAAFGAQLFDV